jgi:hypothetical protein
MQVWDTFFLSKFSENLCTPVQVFRKSVPHCPSFQNTCAHQLRFTEYLCSSVQVLKILVPTFLYNLSEHLCPPMQAFRLTVSISTCPAIKVFRPSMPNFATVQIFQFHAYSTLRPLMFKYTVFLLQNVNMLVERGKDKIFDK